MTLTTEAADDLAATASEESPAPDETLPPTEVLTPTAGWYLLNGYRLFLGHGSRVDTGELADLVGASQASATEMAAKLADASLVDYETYAGIEPTARGAALAGTLARRQCVVTAFFDRALSHDIDGYTAFRIGFAVPDGAIERLRERVDAPRVDACRRLDPEYETCLVASHDCP